MNVFIDLIFYVTCFAVAHGRLQRVVVKGQFSCGNRPSPGNETWLTLLNHNSIRSNDYFDRKPTDRDGLIRLEGQVVQTFTMDPRVWIHTDCDDWKLCHRRIKVTIPQSYVYTPGSQPEIMFDMGNMNLQQRLPGEDRNCFGDRRFYK